MNIKVGNEIHYVPDILFEDGTYKDEEEYIRVALWLKKKAYELANNQKVEQKRTRKATVKKKK